MKINTKISNSKLSLSYLKERFGALIVNFVCSSCQRRRYTVPSMKEVVFLPNIMLREFLLRGIGLLLILLLF